MSEKNLPPETEREIERLKGRLSDLERLLREGAGGLDVVEMPFTLAGPLDASTSPVALIRRATKLFQIIATLAGTGSTATVVRVYKNGNVVHTVTFPAGSIEQKVNALVENSPDIDRWQVGVTAIGTGAEDLDVQLRFR